ncbi:MULTISPECIES: zinc ribbon domain-containing protein [Clostridia]|uniref:zinc ribbon domain-containing protein n=1 Tax=Clostridia TaxID=186801 RepID=UPI000EA1615C|nr:MULTISPECIES: zinc ribbon domain-containing protein [Clostridia]NBJ71389.1 zinc ribbon domain-containing protein [Roseburia sp. 1XD42-34]RKI74651.1 zinc ribbon domain-containing protein [Clostridium sp. 1xD42-85]
MLYCPYCGVQTKEEETYCIKCGKHLPEDRYNRLRNKPKFFTRWRLPLLSSAFLLFLCVVFYVTLEIRTAKAKEYYIEGEQKVLTQDYYAAQTLFQNALKWKDNFQHAEASLAFMDKAISIEATLKESKQLLKEKKYAQALESLNQSEKDLQDFNGEAVNQMVERITKERNTIKLEKLKHALQQKPDIDQLKILLWDATSIETAEAEQLSANIREQIVNFVFTKASKHLTNNQFNDANVIVKDGLKYAPNSEKLLSLQTTIDKEKVTFETAQQNRIEQAMTTANKEQQLNESEAIKLKKMEITSDDQGNLVVKGQVQSVATIPINSIMVEYIIKTNKGEEILTNEVYVFPDELYPDETGNFEFTHYDMNDKNEALKVEVKTITWYPE